MTRVFAQKILVALLVMAFAASPFAGVVCIMSCADSNADSNGVCCCTSAGIPGELSYEKPSCCEPEVSASAESDTATERITGNGRTILPAFVLSPSAESADPGAGTESAGGPLSAESGTARSSPVFLLNSAFLI